MPTARPGTAFRPILPRADVSKLGISKCVPVESGGHRLFTGRCLGCELRVDPNLSCVSQTRRAASPWPQRDSAANVDPSLTAARRDSGGEVGPRLARQDLLWL